MDILVKASAVVLVSSVCALLIKNKNPEFSFVLALLGSAAICCAAIGMAGRLADFISDVIDGSGLSSAVFMPVIKCVGIAMITKITCELCRDAGQAAVSSAVEYLGCIVAVYTALPLMQSLMKTLEGLL